MNRLDEYASFIMGQAPASKDCNTEGIGTPFVKAGQFGEKVPVVDEWTTNPLKMAENNDVLICVVGATSGKLNRSIECAIGRSVAAIRPSSNVRRDYIYYGLHPWITRLRNNSQGSAIGVITKEMLASIELPFPELDEQDKIIALLQSIERVISKRKQELQKLEELIKSRFVEMFGDPVAVAETDQAKPFKDFIEEVRYGTSQPPAFCGKGEYKFIRATNIKNARISEYNMLFINQIEADKIAKCKLEGNEIIIVRSGVNTGDTCVVSKEYAGHYAGYDIIVKLDLNKANPVFFNELMNTNYMDKIIKPLTKRSAQPHINAQQVQSLPMINAPLELQNQFADFVRQIDKSKVAVQEALDKAQLLFDSLMQEYFG